MLKKCGKKRNKSAGREVKRNLAKGESREYNLIIDFRRPSHLYISLTVVGCPLRAKLRPGAEVSDDSATVPAQKTP